MLVVVSLALLTVYFRESSSGGLHGVQSAGSTALRPFEVAANRVAQPFRDAADWVGGLNGASSERDRLKKENEKLKAETIRLQAAADENRRLLRNAGYASSPAFPAGYRAVTTRVIGRPSGQLDQRVVVDVGAADGVQAHDPVVTAEGLVGQVTKVATHIAQVTLVTDPTSYVSARDPRTGATGIVRHFESGTSVIIFDQVAKEEKVNQGDPIVTAGWHSGNLSSIYPRGIPIANVTGVSQVDIDPYKQIEVKPLVDLDQLDFMIVMVPKPQPQPKAKAKAK